MIFSLHSLIYPFETLLEWEDRLLFGSDFPNIPYDFAESYNYLFEMGLPKSFYEKVLAINAKRLYGI